MPNAKELIGAVVEEKDGTFTYHCGQDVLNRPVVKGSPVSTCRWFSAGWEDEADAEARGRAHEIEHESGEPMSELVDSEEYQRQIETQRRAAEDAAFRSDTDQTEA